MWPAILEFDYSHKEYFWIFYKLRQRSNLPLTEIWHVFIVCITSCNVHVTPLTPYTGKSRHYDTAFYSTIPLQLQSLQTCWNFLDPLLSYFIPSKTSLLTFTLLGSFQYKSFSQFHSCFNEPIKQTKLLTTIAILKQYICSLFYYDSEEGISTQCYLVSTQSISIHFLYSIIFFHLPIYCIKDMMVWWKHQLGKHKDKTLGNTHIELTITRTNGNWQEGLLFQVYAKILSFLEALF